MVTRRSARRPRFAAGCVVVRREADGLRYLLLRVYDYWDFPKGGVDPGEEPLAAARREVEEETTLRELRFPWGEVYRDTPAYSGGKVARYYLAEAPSGEVSLPVSPELGRPEHHEWRWVSLDEAEELLPPRLAIVLDWVRQTLA